MTITKSNVAEQIVKHGKSKSGDIHFFKHIAVVEVSEGVHVNLQNGREILDYMMNYFGNKKPFGIVANRVNSYSISLLDTVEVRSIFPNLVAYGIVSYDQAGRMNAAIESQFCESDNICFDTLIEGMEAVYKQVINRITVSLN